MTFKDRQEHISVFKVVCSIIVIVVFILAIGFFSLIVAKHCVFSKEPIKSAAPVLDKFHEEVRKNIK